MIKLRVRVLLIVSLPAALLVAGPGLLRLWQEEEQLLAEDRRNLALAALPTAIAIENALRDRQVADVGCLLAGSSSFPLLPREGCVPFT